MSRREPGADVRQVLAILWGDGKDPSGDHAKVARLRRPRYALLPRHEAPKALVPIWPPSVTAAVVRNYITPTSASGHSRAAAFVALARVGLLALWPYRTQRQPRRTAGFVDHLSQLLDRETVAGVYLGPRRANRKPVLQLVTPEGALVAYVKVGVDDFTNGRVANETAALTALNRTAFDYMVVPQVFAEGTWRGHRFLVLTPVPTRSDATPAPRAAAMAELSRSFGVEAVQLVEASWWREIERGLASAPGPEALRLRALASQVVEHCGERTLELGAAHGDWSPWNTATVGGRVVAWDWERFRGGVPIGWDAIHYAAERHRVSGGGAAAGLRRMIPDVAAITRGCGSSTNDPHLVFATYLLDLGRRYLMDGQSTGVHPRGPISDWLLGPLTELVGIMTARVRS